MFIIFLTWARSRMCFFEEYSALAVGTGRCTEPEQDNRLIKAVGRTNRASELSAAKWRHRRTDKDTVLTVKGQAGRSKRKKKHIYIERQLFNWLRILGSHCCNGQGSFLVCGRRDISLVRQWRPVVAVATGNSISQSWRLAIKQNVRPEIDLSEMWRWTKSLLFWPAQPIPAAPSWKPLTRIPLIGRQFLCPHIGGCWLASSDKLWNVEAANSLRFNRTFVDPTSCKFLISSTTGCHLDDRRCSCYLNGEIFGLRDVRATAARSRSLCTSRATTRWNSN